MAWKGNARLNARRDSNERPIIQALEAQGFHVVQINGTGVPDLLVSKSFVTYSAVGIQLGPITYQCWLVEVKTPKGKPTKAQRDFRASWAGPPIITLRSVDEALRFSLLVCEQP